MIEKKKEWMTAKLYNETIRVLWWRDQLVEKRLWKVWRMKAKESTPKIQIKKIKTTKRPIRQTTSARGTELSPAQLSKTIKRKRQGLETWPSKVRSQQSPTKTEQIKVFVGSTKATEVEDFKENNDIIT